MPVAHSDLPAALKTAHQALFHREFLAASALTGWRDLTTVTTLTGNDRATYHWFGTPPKPQDVSQGEVSFEDLSKYEHTIEDKLHKVAIEVQRRSLEDDKLGLITPRIQQLAQAFEHYLAELVLLQLNANPTAYDGTALFSGSRSLGSSGTIDNDIAPSATDPDNPTVAEMQAAIKEARQTMANFADDRGRKRNAVPQAIAYHPNVEQTLFQALNGANTPGSVGLVVPAGQGGVVEIAGYKLFRNPISDNQREMHFMNLSNVARPLVFQQRMAPMLHIADDPSSDSAIRRDCFVYSARARAAEDVGEPRDIIRATFT